MKKYVVDNIFQHSKKRFYFNQRKITLFEAFSGIGSQHVAMDILSKEVNFEFEVIGISEIDKYAIASYEAIFGKVKNYGSICDIQEIPQVDIFTYSFPCQDISLAGKRKGFTKGSGTRSGLLWEVERLLENQIKINKLPKILIMENVKALLNESFKEDLQEWKDKLESLGYSNFIDVLNAKDYEIPQNRERVFMISMLGNYSYFFPIKKKLKLRLKDMLEDEVDNKFYLSDKQMEQLKTTPHEQSSILRVKNPNKDVCNTINSMGGGNREQGWKEIMPTLAARDYKDPKVVLIPEATKKGYAEATDGDGVYINRPHQKRGVVQKGMIQTIKTSPDIGVVDNMRIRKLSPRECWRLMGFDDSHFDKAQAVCSNSQLYKQAGNSIVVNVLYYIFKQLFEVRT